MAYCTTDELIAITDTKIELVHLDAFISQADREINSRIRASGLTPPAADEDLKAASINLSRANIITFGRMQTKLTDRSQTKTVRFGDTTIQDDPDKAIAAFKEAAWQSIDAYIATQTGTTPEPPGGIVSFPRSTTEPKR